MRKERNWPPLNPLIHGNKNLVFRKKNVFNQLQNSLSKGVSPSLFFQISSKSLGCSYSHFRSSTGKGAAIGLSCPAHLPRAAGAKQGGRERTQTRQTCHPTSTHHIFLQAIYFIKAKDAQGNLRKGGNFILSTPQKLIFFPEK